MIKLKYGINDMFLTILGLLLLLIPGLLIFCFKNRWQGFLVVLTGSLAWHLVIGLATQALHWFSYPLIITLHSLAAVVILIIFFRKFYIHAPKIIASKTITLKAVEYNSIIKETTKIKEAAKIKKNADGKIFLKIFGAPSSWNWTVILTTVLAGAIILFTLWSVHYFYTGTVTTVEDYRPVVRQSYPYPYFSDEWVGVAFTKYSLADNALPTVNPLIDGSRHKVFPNVFVGFFALLAELFMLLNLDPLTGYPIFSLAAGLLICALIYALVKANQTKFFPALVAALSLPYIINGANLPGLWYLLPFTGGAIMFLICLIALSRKKIFLAWLGGLLAAFLYPPLIIFVAPTLLVELLSRPELKIKDKLKWLAYGAAAIAGIALIIALLQSQNFNKFWDFVRASLWRLNSDGGIPNRPIYRIIPFWILPFSLIGLFAAFKKKLYFLITPVIVGLLLWILYSYSQYFFIIDYARVVVITSWLAVALAGLGLTYLLKKINASGKLTKTNNLIKVDHNADLNKDNRPFQTHQKFLGLELAVIAGFLLSAFFYTERSGWEKLILRATTPSGPIILSPGAPANNYLHADDLKFFQGISRTRFISLPWKGLVIGAATNNYPLHSKASIVTNEILTYSDFMRKNCAEKSAGAKKLHLRYAYTENFICPDFIELGVSREGLHFYEFNP